MNNIQRKSFKFQMDLTGDVDRSCSDISLSCEGTAVYRYQHLSHYFLMKMALFLFLEEIFQ